MGIFVLFSDVLRFEEKDWNVLKTRQAIHALLASIILTERLKFTKMVDQLAFD